MRNYQLARQLAVRSSVTFVEMRGNKEQQHVLPDDSGLASVVTLEKCRTYTASTLLRGLVGPTPATVLNCWSHRSASQLAELLRFRQFDTVQIEGIHLMQYLPIIREMPRCPGIIVDWHNIESELMSRYASTSGNWLKKLAAKRTATLIERAEDWLLDTCSTHTVTSERERQKLLARRPSANVQVIPNGVDANYCSAIAVAEASRRTGQADSRQRILFVGSMDYHANIDAVVWFSQVAWPEIARKHPRLHFQIVGRDPAPKVRALASARIHITGTVGDVRPFYASAMAVVVPVRSGSGTRLKILEAMAAGVPVVSTRLGIEGIDAKENVHFLPADSGREIIAAVNLLASSVETRIRLSEAARALVVSQYDWSIVGEQLYRIHLNLAQSRQSSCLQAIS